MIEREHLLAMCDYIKQILCQQRAILWSWGAENFRNIEYRDMPAVQFTVNGFIHKGDVVIAYNGGCDYFEVFCLDANEAVVKSKDDVYLDELVGVVDGLVEKDCSQPQYNAQIKEWGATI